MQNRIIAAPVAVLAAALALGAATDAMAQAAAAPASSTPGGIVAPGIAYANAQAVVGASAAYKTAMVQLPVTYKAQIDAVNTRRNQITAQLKPLYDKFEADQKAAKPDQASLRTQAAQIQQIEQSAEREIQQMAEPLNVAQQYIIEQISDKLTAATQAAMTKRKITLVLDSQSVLKADAVYNLNQDILNELNTLVPSVQLVPPAGWLPRAQREAAAQQAAQGGAAPAAPAPAGKAPEGR
ncbi:OmpH family outer membrane protein [Novosphingobium sp.]|jgi:Skp family chaperone for outer membrane proteins|uniref:OmpH family outer membrane protein n=1 Tax=Novosphingobium sp. TaxID=1874826 RepID=UPI002611F05D|nr:OmpH family outer membrane protein [Novosphingobium sp.]